MLKVGIYQDSRGLWRWRAKKNGRIVADSGEAYANRSNARRAVHNLNLQPGTWEWVEDAD